MRTLKFTVPHMRGPDVEAWQQFLASQGDAPGSGPPAEARKRPLPLAVPIAGQFVRRLWFLLEVLICLLVLLWIGQKPAEAGLLACRPGVLYRGDSLTVNLPMPHGDYEFAVWAESLELMMISFEPGPKDTIAPIIAPDMFRTMKQIKLLTTEARGSSSDFWHGSDVPRASGSPKPIFTETGLYEVLLGQAIGAEDADFDGCWVNYVDRPRPKSEPRASDAKPLADGVRNRTGELADVGSITMSADQVRALRKAAKHHGALMIQEGDHFHLQF